MPGPSSRAERDGDGAARSVPRVLAYGLAYGLAGLLLASLAPLTPRVPQPSPAVAGACTPVDPFMSAALGRLEADDAALFTNGSVALRVCEPGTLTMRARGTSSGGHGAHLVVAGPSTTRFDAEVDQPVELRFEIHQPGWIVAAFVNDAADGEEDRNLWLSDLTFAPGR